MNLDLLINPINTRLLWTVGIISIGTFFYWLGNRIILARANANDIVAGFALGENPILLYFTTPTCAPCKTVQRPAIQSIKERLGDKLQIIEIDATVQPDIANHWGVISVPTTFLIDGSGRPRHVNHGVATADRLLKQVEDLYE
jgi:thioredoxin 1